MKKWFALVLAVIMVCSMTACGNKGNDTQTDPAEGSTATVGSNKNPAATGATEATLPENWGVSGTETVQGEDLSITRLVFKWPAVKGISAGTGIAGTQGDGTFVMVDTYVSGKSPENVELTNFFPSYKEQVVNAFAQFYGSLYKNVSLTAEKDEVCTINGYEVCKYTGRHVFQNKENDRDYQFVVYVTTAKTNGRYVYFLVMDITEDQSAGTKIQEHARNMILSLREE